jgi:hypothetical protein
MQRKLSQWATENPADQYRDLYSLLCHDPLDADHLDNLQVLCTICHRAKTKTDLKVLSRVR